MVKKTLQQDLASLEAENRDRSIEEIVNATKSAISSRTTLGQVRSEVDTLCRKLAGLENAFNKPLPEAKEARYLQLQLSKVSSKLEHNVEGKVMSTSFMKKLGIDDDKFKGLLVNEKKSQGLKEERPLEKKEGRRLGNK